MQKHLILNQLKEAAAKAKGYIAQLEADELFSHDETEEFLKQVEKMYRNLSVYEHLLKSTELAGDLNVHLKIMQTVTNIESNEAAEKIVEPVVELKQEAPVEVKKEEGAILKTIELSINNKFRVANELFAQSQVELQAALQQLNTMTNQEDASRYLDSLKQIYKWKDENPQVKSFYALVQKRFA
ncbi:MAG: hypothetical protein ACXVNR_06175 [Bacteroidia bacterium]